jgi:hypothetical protein
MKKTILFLSALALIVLAGCSNGTSGTSAASSVSGTSTVTDTSVSTGASTGGHSGGGAGNSGNQPGGGGTSASATYSGATTFTSDTTEDGKTYASTTADQSAVLVQNGANAVLTNPTITKSGDTSSADNSSFYGVNASLLSTKGNAYVKNGTVTSTAEGGAGLCGYSSTGFVYASGTTITTSKNAAGGIHVCGGGTVDGWDLTATTQGEHSAAIRSDRGGGTIVEDGGTFTSNGSGSPAIYSTADITVHNADLISNGSEAAAIEGKNAIRLFDCSLSGNGADSSQNDNTWGVILYQSMSGDSAVGTAEFDMVGGTLDIKNGGYFHSTNTSSKFLLSGVTLNHTGNDAYEYLVRATGSSRWGSGTGPTCNFTASAQTMTGKIIYDTASALDVYLKDTSTWTGATEVSTTYTGSKTSSISIEAGSKWVVTGNSTISALNNAGTIVDASGNTVTITDSTGTKVTGTSSYTVTVTGTYSTTASMSSAVTTPSWTSYEVTKPTVLA